MEEARQHSAVTTEQIALSVVYFAGLLALPTGIILQFAIGGRSLQAGLMAFLLARSATLFWRALRPLGPLVRQRSRIMAATTGTILLAFAFAVGLSFSVWR